jgi:hypothetical protein
METKTKGKKKKIKVILGRINKQLARGSLSIKKDAIFV